MCIGEESFENDSYAFPFNMVCKQRCMTLNLKRKDFAEMFIHHLATLALLTLSWTTQMHRIGSLVILVHDFADHWMELAKMARYANLNVETKLLKTQRQEDFLEPL